MKHESYLSRLLALTIVGALAVTMFPMPCAAQSIMLAPHKLVLNAKGQSESVQALFGMNLPAGFVPEEHEVALKIGGATVLEAYDLEYCPIDDVLHVYFDRAALQTAPEVVAAAGETVTVTVEGWFVAVDPDGEELYKTILGTGTLEVVAPARK